MSACACSSHLLVWTHKRISWCGVSGVEARVSWCGVGVCTYVSLGVYHLPPSLPGARSCPPGAASHRHCKSVLRSLQKREALDVAVDAMSVCMPAATITEYLEEGSRHTAHRRCRWGRCGVAGILVTPCLHADSGCWFVFCVCVLCVCSVCVVRVLCVCVRRALLADFSVCWCGCLCLC